MARRVGSAYQNAPSRARGAHTSGAQEATTGGVEDLAKKSPRERTFGVVAFRSVQLPAVGCFDFRDW
jgi:hypothetical protein